MKYYFVLGTNVALSVAELGAVVDLKEPRLLAADFLVAEAAELDADKLIRQLGGMVKIGRIVAVIKSGDDRNLLGKIAGVIEEKQAQSGEGKFNFGISAYGKRFFKTKDIGLKIKKYFQEEGVSTRFVVSREKTLSSVVVAQNKLLARGIEIVLAGDGDDIIIGQTLAVQAFKDLSLRDYGRPSRDDRSGMLPPKLAQIMINLAGRPQAGAVLADPFCGSGTILTEAMLMGYENLLGSDISPDAVRDTGKNIRWVEEMYKIKGVKPQLAVESAERLSEIIKPGSVDAIVTEPYLGPQRGRLDFAAVTRDLEKLYSDAIAEFSRALKPGGRAVMVWPIFYGERPITPVYKGFRLVNPVSAEIAKNKFISLTKRGTIIYGRPGQKVYREIVVLQKE